MSNPETTHLAITAFTHHQIVIRQLKENEDVRF